MSFEVTVTPTVYNVEVEVNPSVQPFDVVVEVGNVPDLDLTTNGDSGASTFDPLTGELNIPEYTLDGLGGVPESRTITINGTTQDLSADRTFTIPAPDPVTIGSPANGLAIDGNQVLTIGLASGSTNGALSSTDWSTFNGKGDLSSSGSYSNPSWITSLDWSKISNEPTTLAGYGITDGQLQFLTATATLTTGGWTLISGLYEQSISNANITATSIVDIIPNNADILTVQTAQILPRTDSASGSVKVYSTNLPTANIGVTINIWR